jgi:uncharacterized protein YjiS (DUF1127 family)
MNGFALPRSPLGKAMLKSVMDTFRVWRRRQHAIREVSRLTDRDLAEIGIYRSEIAAIARGSAQT